MRILQSNEDTWDEAQKQFKSREQQEHKDFGSKVDKNYRLKDAMAGEAINKEKFSEGLMREMLWAEVPRTLANYEKTRKQLGEGFGEENQN